MPTSVLSTFALIGFSFSMSLTLLGSLFTLVGLLESTYIIPGVSFLVLGILGMLTLSDRLD